MKYASFVICFVISIANFLVAIWEHNLNLAGAWSFGFFSCLSSLLAHLALDEERKQK